MISIECKKDLVKEISNLSNNEHIEIFKIIRNRTDKYTKNDNGIFINISILDNETINMIKNFVIFCLDNKERLEEKEEIIRTEQDKMFKKNENKKKEENIIKTISVQQDDKIKDIIEDDMEGIKISLKKLKPKYIGVKAKIIKNYKQNTGNIQNIVYKKNNRLEVLERIEDNEYDIGEEIYDEEQDNNDSDEVNEIIEE